MSEQTTIRGGLVRPARPRLKGTPQNPTVASLLAEKDKSDWVLVRIPKVTKVASVKYGPIRIGSLTMQPGEERRLPPELAAEFEKSIANFEAVPAQQLTGRVEVQRGVLEELAAQADFERRRMAVAVAEAK